EEGRDEEGPLEDERPARKTKAPKKKRTAKKKVVRDEPSVSGGRRKKRRKAEAADGSKGDAEADGRRHMPWLALILVLGLVELVLFGWRGEVEVCVAKDGVHDFALLGTPRTEENTRRFPTCETRLNLGMRSHYDEVKEDAVIHACRRANILFGKQAILMCAIEQEGWKQRVTTRYLPPWNPDFRKRLFWFLGD
ncbi:MAG: hypothetical protein KC731_15800, partial [Myxococcales bacterium]|nr:hypothetical protein [Myxococcales bacterium]